MDMPVITLTSDFGTKDWFPGVMKGVILQINPQACIVDISHDVPPFNLHYAAYLLDAFYKYFPQNAVHIVVIDPTVGTKRKSILLDTGTHRFIGPDNGVFTKIIDRYPDSRVFHLTQTNYHLDNPNGQTFDGRDVFSAVGAYLSTGVKSEKTGPELEISSLVKLNSLEPVVAGQIVTGHVIYSDRFGNLITNIRMRDIAVIAEKARGLENLHVTVPNLGQLKIYNTYAHIGLGCSGCVINSMGYLEIASNQSSAMENSGIAPDSLTEIVVSYDR